MLDIFVFLQKDRKKIRQLKNKLLFFKGVVIDIGRKIRNICWVIRLSYAKYILRSVHFIKIRSILIKYPLILSNAHVTPQINKKYHKIKISTNKNLNLYILTNIKTHYQVHNYHLIISSICNNV